MELSCHALPDRHGPHGFACRPSTYCAPNASCKNGVAEGHASSGQGSLLYGGLANSVHEGLSMISSRPGCCSNRGITHFTACRVYSLLVDRSGPTFRLKADKCHTGPAEYISSFHHPRTRLCISPPPFILFDRSSFEATLTCYHQNPLCSRRSPTNSSLFPIAAALPLHTSRHHESTRIVPISPGRPHKLQISCHQFGVQRKCEPQRGLDENLGPSGETTNPEPHCSAQLP